MSSLDALSHRLDVIKSSLPAESWQDCITLKGMPLEKLREAKALARELLVSDLSKEEQSARIIEWLQAHNAWRE